ncbi:hypothetical protein BMETH_474_1 [methanotrophic bacterial endosymbiont of Bathymodiolus sp.]|nr:hypothetical protein BMETH_474_1 [methanotrophic bacterial endosymbiont of Bathymodiolus sp.]
MSVAVGGCLPFFWVCPSLSLLVLLRRFLRVVPSFFLFLLLLH